MSSSRHSIVTCVEPPKIAMAKALTVEMTPGGFYRGNSARERFWKTKSGKAAFTAAAMLSATGVQDAPERYRLVTLPETIRWL